ncbi:hypothetical protein [Streptomyces sp. NPDC008092]
MTAKNLMANLADGCGADVEICIKALTTNRFPLACDVGRRTS